MRLWCPRLCGCFALLGCHRDLACLPFPPISAARPPPLPFSPSLHRAVFPLSNIHDHTWWRPHSLLVLHSTRLFQDDVTNDLGGGRTQTHLLNEGIASPHELELPREVQGRKDDADRVRIRACFKTIGDLLLQIEYHARQCPMLAKAHPAEGISASLRCQA